VTTTEFTLNRTVLTALPSGALWIAEFELLCVSDLHLGKSERMARKGGLLVPPYDSRETLHRMAEDMSHYAPKRVLCLGDNFDDQLALAGLDVADRDTLNLMMAGRRWIWITGNHDPGPVDVGGTWLESAQFGSLEFRHIAEPCANPGEISGHYHPKHRLQGARGSVTRKAFLYDDTRLILPAYGAYTGGLWSSDAHLRSLFGPQAIAILTGKKTMACPMN